MPKLGAGATGSGFAAALQGQGAELDRLDIFVRACGVKVLAGRPRARFGQFFCLGSMIGKAPGSPRSLEILADVRKPAFLILRGAPCENFPI
ncbi:hypothetical protein NOVOSPHI9U_310074 [Novosphingobium sp. 9U]|nr:hypothetical protein NOVOSPHI9U_310074 [Novosphingobium sp. 9U]